MLLRTSPRQPPPPRSMAAVGGSLTRAFDQSHLLRDDPAAAFNDAVAALADQLIASAHRRSPR